MTGDPVSFLQQRFSVTSSACVLAAELAARVVSSPMPQRPFVLGISGAQGSGKSTLAALVECLLAEVHGRTVATLSLDDFYLTKAERLDLSRKVHPLCATRGVAGTHDIGLLGDALTALERAAPDRLTRIPRFDKLADDRAPSDQWHEFHGRPDCVILEGWCVGLRASHLAPWTGPTNALESAEDAQGIWAKWSAAQLPAYEAVWDRIDLLLGIRLSDMDVVVQSRLKQEQAMVAAGGDPARAMDEAAICRFVQHYERHTLALWDHFGEVADVLVRRSAGFDYEPLEQG